MNPEQDALPNNQTILSEINNLQAFVTAKFNEVGKRFQVVENLLEDMRFEMMSFDVRIDRLQAMSHENLNLAYGFRAEVKVLREEVSPWSKEVIGLQLKAA